MIRKIRLEQISALPDYSVCIYKLAVNKGWGLVDDEKKRVHVHPAQVNKALWYKGVKWARERWKVCPPDDECPRIML